jgi:hypothetical protein
MKKTRLIFQHGFGTSPLFFANLLPLVVKNYECVMLDSGYFGECSSNIPTGEDFTNIGIGHSVGFAKLVNRSDVTFDAIVSLGGFSKYIVNDAFKIAIEDFKERIIKNAKTALVAQQKEYIGLPQEFTDKLLASGEINVARLLDDIDLLQTVDVREKINNDKYKIMHLVGSSDISIFDHKLQIDRDFEQFTLDGADHSLGYNNTHWCVNHINTLISIM